MTKRAAKLAEYLESNLGWAVYERKKTCPDCKRRSWSEDSAYCDRCGGMLEIGIAIENKVEIEYELERAIQYCLIETEE